MDDWPTALKVATSLMLASRFPKALIWGEELITLHNDAFKPLLGDKPEAIGRSFADVWAEAWTEIGPIAARAFAGEATFIEDFPLRIDRRGYEEEAFFTFCYGPIRDENGVIVGMMDTVVETTATVRARQRAEAVNSELAHRMRNLVTMANALVAQTLRGEGGLEEKREILLGRLNALGDVHALLASETHPQASVRQLLDAVLTPRMVARERVAADGETIVLSSEAALGLSLALNELLTNAIKYGALSGAAGRVEVTWRRNGGGLDLQWREVDGPPVTAPERRGFGSRLIERYVATALHGRAVLDYATAGLVCEIHAGAPALVDG